MFWSQKAKSTYNGEKGEIRVHLIGDEHAENIKILTRVNGLDQAVPPMLLFKGLRLNDRAKATSLQGQL